MVEIFIALMFVAGIVGLILLSLFALDILVPGVALLIPLALFLAFVFHSRISQFSYRRWRITPERITGSRHQLQLSSRTTVEDLAQSITERANEIRRAMKGDVSEIQIEMCAMGYQACIDDMITLTHLVNQELPEAALIRRMKLRRTRRKATDSLSAARQTLPAGALRASRQEQQ